MAQSADVWDSTFRESEETQNKTMSQCLFLARYLSFSNPTQLRPNNVFKNFYKRYLTQNRRQKNKQAVCKKWIRNHIDRLLLYWRHWVFHTNGYNDFFFLNKPWMTFDVCEPWLNQKRFTQDLVHPSKSSNLRSVLSANRQGPVRPFCV